jgi:hypothetical protein
MMIPNLLLYLLKTQISLEGYWFVPIHIQKSFLNSN